MAVAVLLAAAGVAGASPTSTVPAGEASSAGEATLRALLERADAAGDRAGTLDRLARLPLCFSADATPEQIEELIARFDLLPPGGFVNRDRFFTSGTVWTGNSGQGFAGNAARATLRYSFPSDGIAWGNTASPNNLNAVILGRFGAANTDRGREYFRQGLASWRRTSGLNYNEVSDNGTGFSTGTSAFGVGDVRIGAIPQGNGGVLAYNFFPQDGGDMTMNSDELTPGSMFDASNSYRYLRNVVAHEHGHGIGFIHSTPCNGSKLMEPFATTNFDGVQTDEVRGAHRNYGDRFAGNNSAGNARALGNLTSPIVKSVIERNLSTNGSTGPNNTDEDWFSFTLGSAQTLVITAAPTGGTYANGQQTGGCNPNNPGSVNASAAGNLNIELRNSSGNTVLQTAAAAAAGASEVLSAGSLAAGTYTVRVFDVGPNSNQTVQLYDLTVRVGTSKAPPQAIAGLNKRVAAGQACFFMGDINTRVNEPGATINSAGYDWDLDGNGTFETTDSPQPTFVYPSNGTFNATLRVTDSNGMVSTDTITVAVVGAVPSISSVTPSAGQLGATIPVTIVGTSLNGVASVSQLSFSLPGIDVIGTPSISGGGTTINGLSFVIAPGAALGSRNLTITNADGTGENAIGLNAFTVNNAPPGNDLCAAPISWGSVTGPRPFTNVSATTGATQSFPGTGCPAAGPINNDVWYTWTAPVNGSLVVTTDSASSVPAFSSRVAAYLGTTCPPVGGSLRGCDDFGFAFGFSVVQGQTYLFQVGSIFAATTGTANVILTLTAFTGACCDSGGACTVTSSDQCIGSSLYQGNNTTCDSAPCPEPDGTCCDAGGGCTIIDQASCSGVWSGGGVCTPNPCAQPAGACCLTDGGCTVLEQAMCSGTWTLGGSCTPNPCAQPTGSCCVTEGGCMILEQSMCPGTWSAGGSCTPNPCPQPTGACCGGTACTITTAAACSGSFQGAGSVCGEPGNPTTCCPANFNDLGGVTVQDIFDFLAGYFANAPEADFNGQSGITVQDIFDFLSAYFTGCP